jgi:hypothetical protein
MNRTLSLPAGLLPWLACLLAGLVVVGCDPRSEPATLAPSPLTVAGGVLEAVQEQDGERLAALAHPELGVRFSPYAYVDVAQDRVLDRSELATLWQDQRIHAWGSFDGSGEPIRMTAAQYVGRFVMSRDFTEASVITVNGRRARGNTADNSAEVYPRGTVVEFYAEPAEGRPETDWAALRLVLEQHAGKWQLVGVIHDEWTP